MAEVNIGVVNIDKLFISEELLRSGNPEVLRDIGHQIAPDAPEQPVDDAPTPEQEEERLQDLADNVTPIGDHVKPRTRREHLYKAIRWAARFRKLSGGVTTTQETSLNDIESAENAMERYGDNFEELLARACARCAFQGNCRLEGKGQAWLDRHPDQTKVTNKGQESLQAFRERLSDNPMAHCMTPGQPRELPRQQAA